MDAVVLVLEREKELRASFPITTLIPRSTGIQDPQGGHLDSLLSERVLFWDPIHCLVVWCFRGAEQCDAAMETSVRDTLPELSELIFISKVVGL